MVAAIFASVGLAAVRIYVSFIVDLGGVVDKKTKKEWDYKSVIFMNRTNTHRAGFCSRTDKILCREKFVHSLS